MADNETIVMELYYLHIQLVDLIKLFVLLATLFLELTLFPISP